MTARHRRNRQKRIEKFVESSVSVGALIGLWIALSEDHPARHCTKREIREQTCMNQALQDAVMPYVTHAFTGALIGLLAAAAVVLGWKWLRDAQPPRPQFRRESLPQRVRHDVWRRDKGCCVDCGSRERLEYDHIIPVSSGGSNTTRAGSQIHFRRLKTR
jgi:hypothetical protein